MNIAVLGANGFIGRSICTLCLEKGYNVLAIFNQNKSHIPEGCSTFSINNLPKHKIDCLIVAIGNYSLKHIEYVEQFLLLKQTIDSLEFEKIVLISSTAVYGSHKEIIFLNSCFNNPNIYGHSKIAQEFLVKSYNNHIIVRPTYIYGAGMNEGSLIPIWKNAALNKKEISVFGDGKRAQDYLHVSDLAELCVLAAKSDVSNVEVIAATGASVSNTELANIIIKDIPDATIKYVGNDFMESSRFDVSETNRLLNWYPVVSLETGLKHYIGYANSDL